MIIEEANTDTESGTNWLRDLDSTDVAVIEKEVVMQTGTAENAR